MINSKEYESDDYKLSYEHQDELNKRLAQYDRGQLKFSSWEEARARIKAVQTS